MKSDIFSVFASFVCVVCVCVYIYFTIIIHVNTISFYNYPMARNSTEQNRAQQVATAQYIAVSLPDSQTCSTYTIVTHTMKVILIIKHIFYVHSNEVSVNGYIVFLHINCVEHNTKKKNAEM